MSLFAKFISFLFHPLLIPVLGTLLLFHLNISTVFSLTFSERLWILGILLINTVLFPLVAAILLKLKGQLSSLHMPDKNERQIPFLITLVFYMSTFWIFLFLKLPSILIILSVGAVVSVFLAIIMTKKFKISIHMMGAGGMVGLLLSVTLMGYEGAKLFLIPMVLLSGIIGFSRIALHAHKLSEIYSGFVVGALVQTSVIFIFY